MLQAVVVNRVPQNHPPVTTSLPQDQDHPDLAAADKPSAPTGIVDLTEPSAFSSTTARNGSQTAATPSTVAAAAAHTRAAAQVAGGQYNPSLGVQRFSSLEVVVGRGAHSVAGVPRLKPCVVSFLTGKGFRPEAVEGGRGTGAVVVSLAER